MSKIRLTMLIISFITLISLSILIIFDPDRWLAYFIFSVIILFCNFRIKKIDRDKLLAITMIYLDDCDPDLYLQEISKYQRTLVRTKSGRLLNLISRALILLDGGRVDETVAILKGIARFEAKMSAFVRFWYYKAWFYYLEEMKYTERIEVLMAEMFRIANSAPLRFRSQLLDNYQLILCRYYVLTCTHLDRAEKSFAEVFAGNYPKLVVVVSHYYLGLIAFKQGQYEKALNRFHYVTENGPKLHVAHKSLDLIKRINEKLNYTNTNPS